MSTSTPWGASQQSEQLATGIMQYSTASHGGIHLSPTRNMVIPEYMRNDNGWYEEDCEWVIPATVFPEAWVKRYDGDESILETIYSTLRNWYPEMFEVFYSVHIKHGTSLIRDQQIFFKEHKDDWIVVSASSVGDMVECMALLGGRENIAKHNSDAKTFLVSDMEYADRTSNGFVIDLNKHIEKGKEPTWKNTLYDHLQAGGPYNDMADMIDEAYKLGYSYMCWNGRIYSINKGDSQPYEMDTGFVMDDVK